MDARKLRKRVPVILSGVVLESPDPSSPISSSRFYCSQWWWRTELEVILFSAAIFDPLDHVSGRPSEIAPQDFPVGAEIWTGKTEQIPRGGILGDNPIVRGSGSLQ